MACVAWICDLLTRTLTSRARLLHREKALLHPHLPMAATGGAVDWLRAFLCAIAVAGFTSDGSRNLDFYSRSTYRVFQAQVEVVA